jgi:HlyD family secretion protein
LEPVVTQNVVTYATVIDVDNPQLKLRPGMTAMATIEVARRDNVLKVPTSALRFKPTGAVLASLGASAAIKGASAIAPAASPARATLWRYDGNSITGLKVATGLSDATSTEIVSGPLAEGDTVVTAASLAPAPGMVGALAGSANAASNPLLGPQRRGMGPGGPR